MKKAARFYTCCLFLISVLLLSACHDTRVYHHFNDLENTAWPADSIQVFTFDITDVTKSYDLFYQVRNTADYQFYNLYMRFSLTDSLHQPVAGELQEVILFDPKTGKPYGSGLGDIFSHDFPALSGFRFPYPGTYRFEAAQYMRVDPLPGIESIGLRVEASK